MSVIENLFIFFFESISWLFDKTGVYAFVRRLHSDKLTILMYHGVTDNRLNAACDPKHVCVDNFNWQLKYVFKHYSVISMEEYLGWLNGKRLPKNSLVFSFDDGYKNNYKIVYPLLKKYNLPAIIYLNAGMVGSKGVAWYDVIQYTIINTRKEIISVGKKNYPVKTLKQKRAVISELKALLYNKKSFDDKISFLELLKKETAVSTSSMSDVDFSFVSWQDCREMQKHSIVFGAHTVNHHVLTEINDNQLQHELQEGKSALLHRLGKCVHFSYPYGIHNSVVVECVRKFYKTAVTTKHGLNQMSANRLLLKRIPVTNTHSHWMFALYLFWNVPLLHHWFLKKYSLLKSLFR